MHLLLFLLLLLLQRLPSSSFLLPKEGTRLLLDWAGKRQGDIAHRGIGLIGADNQHVADGGPEADQGMSEMVAVGR